MDLFQPRPLEWVVYHGVIAFARATGCWKYPIDASGDFERMRLKDKIYWFYKAQFPVELPPRGSGLEQYFQHQQCEPSVPAGFRSDAILRLHAAGDLMNHPYLRNSHGYLYEKVCGSVFGADLVIANLECVVDPAASASFEMRSKTAPALCYDEADFKAAQGADGRRYSLMSLANNHILDRGEAGVARTVDILRTHDVGFAGVNETEERAATAPIVETKGFRIGVISHTFGLNGKEPPADKPWLVNRTALNRPCKHVDFSLMQGQIDDCRRKRTDAVVALLHWGMEHEYYPRCDQLDVAHQIAEIGADLVIGHHPHVVQPVEYYRTKRDPTRVVPIYYSLGNLITPFLHPAFRRSALARVTLARGTLADGSQRTYVTDAGVMELLQDIDTERRRLRLLVA
jgi:poly-gamma-glutamate capsule biosynthesis protein CapA/YwtB (metallophosphatase superfamily)